MQRVLHIGCGAIGSHTALQLHHDIGFLLLCDFDQVSQENVGIADFTAEDVGRQKVNVLADRLRRRVPGLHVATLDADIALMSPGVVDSFDLITAAVDNDRAAYTICRLVALSARKPPVVFANCDPQTSAAQIRIFNFGVNAACLGCARPAARWQSPVASPYSCSHGGTRASTHAARFASALQLCVIADLLSDSRRAVERAGENLIVNPSAGVAVKSRFTVNEECPALYHVYARTFDNTIPLEWSVKETKLGQLLDIIRGQLGDDAFIELGERRCSDRFFCSRCRKEVSMLRFIDSPRLCDCGIPLTPVGETRRLGVSLRDTTLTNITLAQCGFPEGDVILAVNPDRYRYFSAPISEPCKRELIIEA